MDLVVKKALDIFAHKTVDGESVNTLEILNDYMQATYRIALQDIADRNFTVSTDNDGSKSIHFNRTLAQLRKALKLTKDDYFYYHTSFFMKYYDAIFIEFKRAYWRDEKKRLERQKLSKEMNDHLRPYAEKLQKSLKDEE